MPTPAQLGRDLAELFRVWDATGVPLSAIAQELCWEAELPWTFGSAWGAAMELARSVENWDGYPYHSARHHAEVAWCAMMLARKSETGLPPVISPLERGYLLLAALGHDFAERDEGAPPFAAEIAAANNIDAIMARRRVPDGSRNIVRTLVHATAPCCRDIIAGLLAGERVEIPEPIAALAGNPRLMLLAATLCDADVMPSAGLTPEWTRIETERFDRERGVTSTEADMAGFLNGFLRRGFLSPAAQAFNANLQEIRSALVPAPEYGWRP